MINLLKYATIEQIQKEAKRKLPNERCPGIINNLCICHYCNNSYANLCNSILISRHFLKNYSKDLLDASI